MKYITVILAVFILVGNCIGQKVDTINLGGLITGTDNAYSISLIAKKDTVKVLMLVCDTTLIENITHTIAIDGGKKFGESKNHIPYVWWQFGYEVREYSDPNVISLWVYRFKEYLDVNKKPLPKSIVVWQTKEIKQ